MESSSPNSKTIQHQYDAYIKKHLKGEARSFYREMERQSEREISFSAMNESDFNQFYYEDTYEFEHMRFTVSGFDVAVKNVLLGEALEELTQQKRDIILLAYYLDMSDSEIGELLNVVRSTVFRNRKAALAKLKQYMEGKTDEE